MHAGCASLTQPLFRIVAGIAIGLGVSGTALAQANPSVQARIWSYPLSARAPQVWELHAQPELSLGGPAADDQTAFSDVVGIALLKNGQLAVADARANEVRVFTSTGEFARSFGRRGQGPGEFDRIVWSIHSIDATVMASDNSGRTQLFTPAGELLGSRTRPAPSGLVSPQRIGLLRGAAVAVAGVEYPRDTTSGEFEVLRVVLREVSDAAGLRYERVVATPAFTRRPAASRQPPLVFGPVNALAAHDNRICVGHSATYRITCFDARGAVVFRVERDVTPPVVTAELREMARKAYVDGNRMQGMSPELFQRVQVQAQQLRFPEHAPAFGQLLLSDNGELWVSQFDPSARLIGPKVARAPHQRVTWSVHSSTGEWTADILLPARFIPHVVADGVVAGISVDADGVERVQVWRINRSSAGRGAS
jgi:hypothetical protein